MNIFLFLIAAAEGSVAAPLIYYMYGLLYPIWLGGMFATTALGRLVGLSLLENLEQRVGVKRLCVLAESIAASSYAILAMAGHLHITSVQLTTVLYLVRFVTSLATARFPFVPLALRRPNPKLAVNNAGPITQIGFAAGCLLAIAGNDHGIDVRLMTQSLTRSAEYAAVISGVAAIVMMFQPALSAVESEIPTDPVQPYAAMTAISLLSVAAFSMIICILPMTLNETFVFTPAKLSLFFAVAAAIGVATQAQSRLFHLRVGLLAAAMGFGCFVLCVVISRFHHLFNGFYVGTWTVWIALVPAAVGFGLLQTRQRSSRKRLEQLSLIVFAVAALTGSRLWSHQERTAFSIPCVLSIVALTISALPHRYDPANR